MLAAAAAAVLAVLAAVIAAGAAAVARLAAHRAAVSIGPHSQGQIINGLEFQNTYRKNKFKTKSVWINMSWHPTIQLDTVPTLYAYESWLPTRSCTAFSWLCTAISWIRTAHVTLDCPSDSGLPTCIYAYLYLCQPVSMLPTCIYAAYLYLDCLPVSRLPTCI